MIFFIWVTGGIFTFLFWAVLARLIEGPLDCEEAFLCGIIFVTAAIIWPIGLPVAILVLIAVMNQKEGKKNVDYLSDWFWYYNNCFCY